MYILQSGECWLEAQSDFTNFQESISGADFKKMTDSLTVSNLYQTCFYNVNVLIKMNNTYKWIFFSVLLPSLLSLSLLINTALVKTIYNSSRNVWMYLHICTGGLGVLFIQCKTKQNKTVSKLFFSCTYNTGIMILICTALELRKWYGDSAF